MLSGKRYKKYWPYLLLLPSFLIVLTLMFPPLYILVKSTFYYVLFGDDIQPSNYVGLDNYRWIITDGSGKLLHSLRLSAIYFVTTTIIPLLLGLGIALLLNHEKVRGKGIFTAALLIPFIIMRSLVGIIWKLYFAYDGLVNYFLDLLLGLRINWYSPDFALSAAIIATIWVTTPFFGVVILAALQSLPREPYEAAKVDGASPFQNFIYITLPLIKPVLVIITLLRSMESLRAFELIFPMFAQGPGGATEVLPIYISTVTLNSSRFGRGNVISLVMLCLILVLFAFYYPQTKKGKIY